MNVFDKTIIQFLNGFVGVSPALDDFLVLTQFNDMLNGGVLVAAIWYLWFSRQDSQPKIDEVRQKLIASICAMALGVLVARFLAHALPFSLRPLHNPELNLRFPSFINGSQLEGWSSFPSDHAVLWFALAAGIFYVNRIVGCVVLAYVSLLSIARIYACIHNPTDIIAGAAMGVGFSMLFCSARIRELIYIPVAYVEREHSGWFYFFAFLFTCEITYMFNDIKPFIKILAAGFI